MKKLSLAMAAAMCLTVGGVYATWNYAESASIANANPASMVLKVTDATPQGAVVSVSATSTLKLWFDGQTVGQNNNVVYIDEDHTDAGKLIVTVSTHSSNDRERNLNVNVKLNLTHHIEFDHTGDGIKDHIFSAPSATGHNISLTLPAGANSHTYEWTLAEVLNMVGLSLNGTIILETYEEYNDFVECVSNASAEQVVVTVTEVPVEPTNN